jgi:NTE family protein
VGLQDRRESMAQERIGLALGGGGARGLVHIGVLKAVEERGIEVAAVAGTSMGALIGAIYAHGKDPHSIEEIALGINWRTMFQLTDLTVPKAGLIQGRRARDMLKSIIGDVKFSDLRVPFACVAADIETGEEITLSKGSVLDAVRASISIPVIFTPARVGGRFLVDGGLVNPVPVSTVKRMGATFVIAVNPIAGIGKGPPTVNGVGAEEPQQEISSRYLDNIRDSFRRIIPRYGAKPGQGERKVNAEGTGHHDEGKTSTPTIFRVIMQTIHIAAYQYAMASVGEADVIISPPLRDVGPWDFHKARQCIVRGELAAAKALAAARL